MNQSANDNFLELEQWFDQASKSIAWFRKDPTRSQAFFPSRQYSTRNVRSESPSFEAGTAKPIVYAAGDPEKRKRSTSSEDVDHFRKRSSADVIAQTVFKYTPKIFSARFVVVTRELRTFPRLESALEYITQLSIPYWLDCECVTSDELDIMQQHFKFHDITKKDLFEEDPSISDEKLSHFQSYIFFIFDVFSASMKTRNLNLLVYKSHLVSTHQFQFHELNQLYHRIVSVQNHSSSWIAYLLSHTVLQSHIKIIKQTASQAEDFNEEILELLANSSDANAEDFIRISRSLRRRIRLLKSSLASKKNTLERIVNLAEIEKSAVVLFKSLNVKLIWEIQRLEGASETLRATETTYVTLLSLRVAREQSKTNDQLKILSVLLAITTPGTLIASIFSMNLYPLSVIQIDNSSNPTSFIVVVCFLCTITSLLLYLAKQKHWI